MGQMRLLPKPRGFWDYSLFVLAMTGLMLGLFWVEASDHIGWADAVLAFSASALLVLAIILGRRNEKAAWIVRPSRWVTLISTLGILILTFGAIYADEYLLHRQDIKADRLQLHLGIAIALLLVSSLRLLKRKVAQRRLC